MTMIWIKTDKKIKNQIKITMDIVNIRCHKQWVSVYFVDININVIHVNANANIHFWPFQWVASQMSPDDPCLPVFILINTAPLKRAGLNRVTSNKECRKSNGIPLVKLGSKIPCLCLGLTLSPESAHGKERMSLANSLWGPDTWQRLCQWAGKRTFLSSDPEPTAVLADGWIAACETRWARVPS